MRRDNMLQKIQERKLFKMNQSIDDTNNKLIPIGQQFASVGYIAPIIEVFTAGENQVIYNLTTGRYDISRGAILFIGGSIQTSPENFTKTSATSFTLSATVREGTKIIFFGFRIAEYSGGTFLTGITEPLVDNGKNGDFYLQLTTGDFYKKEADSWGTPITNLKGTNNGAIWYDGGTNPASGLGSNGDYYLNTVSGDVFTKTNGTWGSAITNMKGAIGNSGSNGKTWYSDAGAPAVATGLDGDFYFDSTTGDVYKKVSGAWGAPIINLTGNPGLKGDPGTDGLDGINGINGAKWRINAGPPSVNTVGNEGDFLLNTVNGDVYEKISGSWGTPIANLKGINNGAQWYNGAGAPVVGTGADGDYYLNTANGDVYTKVSGSWGTPIANLIGAGAGSCPAGGTKNQKLRKNSDTDYDAIWAEDLERVQVIISNVDWTTQPTIVGGAALDSAFTLNSFWFIVNKNTDGTTLPTNQFKLTNQVGAYATAINQIFDSGGYSGAVNNSAVQFSAIGTEFKMRFGGLSAPLYTVPAGKRLVKATGLIFGTWDYDLICMVISSAGLGHYRGLKTNITTIAITAPGSAAKTATLSPDQYWATFSIDLRRTDKWIQGMMNYKCGKYGDNGGDAGKVDGTFIMVDNAEIVSIKHEINNSAQSLLNGSILDFYLETI